MSMSLKVFFVLKKGFHYPMSFTTFDWLRDGLKTLYLDLSKRF